MPMFCCNTVLVCIEAFFRCVINHKAGMFLQIFRDGAENTEQPGGAILSNTDSKIIFGKIPPILEVHEEIKTDLENLLENWSDDVAVADIILTKVYIVAALRIFIN